VHNDKQHNMFHLIFDERCYVTWTLGPSNPTQFHPLQWGHILAFRTIERDPIVRLDTP
jgi:hypothetical protein